MPSTGSCYIVTLGHAVFPSEGTCKANMLAWCFALLSVKYASSCRLRSKKRFRAAREGPPARRSWRMHLHFVVLASTVPDAQSQDMPIGPGHSVGNCHSLPQRLRQLGSPVHAAPQCSVHACMSVGCASGVASTACRLL